MAANFFDQFDPASAKPEGGGKSGNYFDQFDPGSARPEPAGGTASDLAKSLKVGAQRLPGMVTGLADLPFALAAGARPFTKAADAIGEVTGFQPGKWADETKFSAGYEQGKKAVDDAWKDGGAGDIALAYLKNPGYTANQVVESAPGMVAGGLAGRALMGVGRVAAPAARAGGVGPAIPGLAERALGQWAAPVAAGVGEGAVTAGQQMAQYQGEDQQKNALAALGAGAVTGGLGVGAGRVANKLGLETAETAIAKAGTGAAKAADDVPLSAKRRILGGMVSEALLQELPQSAQEQMWQNWADGKPLMDGVARAATEGAIAGGVMGAGANVSDGGAGKRRALAEQQAKLLAEAEADALRADPSRAWATEPGATDPNQPVMDRAAPPVAPELQTSPGAAGPREGLDFTRDVDTTGLTLEDPAEVERARAATMDYEPADATPQWDTTRGAAAQDRQPGLDMPSPEFDTGALGLESRSMALTPSQRMGIDPAAGPLSKLAASAVDSGITQEAQFLGATRRDLQVRRTGPGVADESNVIDVQGRVVEDRAIGTPRRIEAARRVGGAEAESFSTGANQHQFSANAQANGSAANSAPALSLQAQAAMNSVADQPPNLSNGVPNGHQATQAQQTAQEPAQAGAAPRSTVERAALEGGSGAAGEVVQGAVGVGRAATSQNIGAQGQEAARAQGTAQAAAEPVAGRPDGWRKSMLKAGPVAKAMGIDTKGKRLAQVVAEIDAADAQRTGVRQDGAKSTPVTRAGDIARGLRDQIDGIAAQDKRQGMYRQEAQRLRAAADGMGTTSEPGAAYSAAADMLDAWAGQVGADSVADIAALHEANGPYPPSAATRIGDGQWLPAVKTGPDSGQPIAGAPTFSDAGSAAAWAGYEQAKGRAGADVAALQRLQDSIEGRQQPIGETDAAPRNLRLADERAPGAAAPAQDGAGPAAGGAAPAVGDGRRAGGSAAQPAPAVRAAVPDAGGTGKQGSGVAPTASSQSANSRSASEKLGREVSREIGKYKQGMSEHRANEVRAELARKNPEVIYSVEEDASLKNGFVVVGRKPAPGAKLGVEKLKASNGRAPLQFSRSPSTKSAYEARIDALFAGEKAKTGTRILDSSDVMGLLGYPKVPLMLNESHLRDGLANHPEMTAAAWKNVPQWIENPAAVYTDPRNPSRLTLIAPETLAGYPVVMVIEPNPNPAGSKAKPMTPTESLLVTAYAKTTGGLPGAGMLALGGHLKYMHTQNAPEIWRRGGGQFPKQAALSQGRHKILTEKQLGGYRRANGPAFSFAGSRAATADMHALVTAQDRLDAGEDPETVRQETGWHRGADGRMRFEISDADALLKADTSGAEGRRTIGQMFPLGYYGDEVGLTVGRMLHHPALFAAYPAIADIKVKMVYDLRGDDVKGSFNPSTNTITLNQNASWRDAMSTLLHEIQHGIQGIEGFATGDSPERLAGTMPDEKAMNDAKLLARFMAKGESAFDARQRFMRYMGRDPSADGAYMAERYEPDEIARMASTPLDAYKRSAGEVEARNTQARQNMTDAERRTTSPGSTADVADSDVIVTFNGKEMQNAPAPANAGQTTNPDIRFSRTQATKAAYEARIDALFSGEKPRLQGARVLDRSDMLAFLGFGDGPVNLSEGKVVVGKDNHPHMTAAVWKKIPEWLENPALVFDSDTTQGRLVFIAPEMVNGSPVRIIVEPNAAGGVKAHLLVNAYDAKGGSFRRWESDGLLRYVDRNKYAHVSGSFQPQLAGLPGDRGRRNIVTDKQYNGWRRANTTAYSQEMSPELANTLLAIRRPATKESVRAAVRELVNGLGLLPNRLGRVVVATAAEIKQDWEPLIGSVQLHSEQGDGDGAAQGFYDPKSKTVFLIADHIRQGDELGVVAHELMHKHGQAVLGEDGWSRLHGAIEGWASAPEGSQERRVYDEAAARVRQSRPADAAAQEYSSQELFPYAVQVALEQGVRPNLLAKPGTVARWLGQVKAALRDVWSKIVGKPESFNAQDLVNLAFGIAQRENPEHARELDGAANGAPEDRVGSTLLELGRDERLYQYPKSDSKDIVQIGAAKDLTVGPVDRNASESDEWMLANTTPEDGDGVQSWMVRLPNGKPATITDNKGQVYINVSAVGEGGGGSRVYDLAANYALNNGAVFVGDPNGVSPSAMRRRLENMLSSAIKYGTTDHLAPHPDQVAGRDGVAPLEWTPGDTLGNIESMVKASVAATEATNPLATSHVRFEPQTRSFDIDPDYGGRSGQVAQDLSDLLDFDGRKVGLGQGGRRTVQRAVFFRALLSGVGERRRVLASFRDEQTNGSQGTAAPEEGPTVRRIFYSRSVAATPATGDYTPDQRLASERAFGVQNQLTLAERAKSFRANLGTRLRQGMVDQFAPIKEVSDKAYMLARMSKGSDGAVEAALLYGKPFLRDGVYDVDIKDGGFAKVLATLKGEHDRFFQWVAAQRAERLKAEGKENLLTDQDITALRTLNAGKMADGSARMPVYAAALRELNAFNESTLKVAMESGLIDQAAFDLMKDQPYVPFYRLMEQDGGMRGPRFSSGLVNQQAWKKLKGGTQQINADLMQNTLLNWSHLYGAAARNRASLETMAAAEKMGIAYQVPADTKGAVKVMRDGVAEHWAVEDPYLLDAISAMSYAPGGIVKAMAPFKRLLTFGVTVNPTFKIRNLIRDSLSAIAQSELSYNPLENVAKGWTATSKESQTYASMLASGGIIKFGTQEDSGRVRTLIEKLGGQVLDQDGWSKLKGQMRSLWETYEEFGDRTENVNRAALYERLVAKGHSHAEASFMARDLMDFSMSGKWEVVRFLTQTVPFLNARMQGLYKLGRAAKEDPRRFAAMAGAVSLASLGLLAAYGDDDDWKKREDWDRDNYWWFKIGTMAFRIPKPFEVGAIGTVAERTAELMMSDEMTGKRFGQRISDMVFNTFAMDPTPQFIKPFIDIYANKDSFSGRPIEGLADERLRPQDRYNERTSEVARLLGSWGLPDPVRLAKGEYSGLSPKQIDFLLRGYFGWIATVATTVTDAAARPMLDRGERPAMRLRDTFLAGNFLETLPTGSSRYVSAMYEQARDVEQAWASYQAAVKSGDMDKAREIQQDEAPKLRNRVAVEHAKRQIAELGQQAKRIESNRLMPADEKRRRLDELEARKHEAARRVAPTS